MLKSISGLCAAIMMLGASSTLAQAAELVMTNLKSCSYCVRFNREMAPAYERSEIGRAIPLRRIDPRRWPADLAAVERTPYTPVFILVEEGREVGRFMGYAGPGHFKRKLSDLLARR